MDEQVLHDIDSRLEALQADNRQLLYFNAWFTLGILVTLVVYAFIPPFGVAISLIWIINTVGIIARLQKFVMQKKV